MISSVRKRVVRLCSFLLSDNKLVSSKEICYVALKITDL